jgi:hypothetical protein
MVSCVKCMYPLPYECTCTVSKKERLRKYTEQALKELKLLDAMMDGFKPQVCIMYVDARGETIKMDIHNAKVSADDDFYYTVYVENIPIIENTMMHITLFDVEGKPLYRHVLYVAKDDKPVTLKWKLGIPRGEQQRS